MKNVPNSPFSVENVPPWAVHPCPNSDKQYRHRPRWLSGTLLLAITLVVISGCAVPQKRGNGLCMHRVEPSTQTGYWLYLPEDYVAKNGEHPQGKRWPLVVTFHGMNPYDTANDQIREWQQEADRYGLVVLAPQLRTCDSFMQYPLKDPNLPYVRKDNDGVMAVMDEVFRLTNADPAHVLSTSFSCGGYLAHYFINRYPERFSCLAVRGSNFNRDMLSASQVPKYRDAQIGIFFGENDFKACRDESMEAIDWYRRHGFDVEARKVAGLGHERKPQLAAAVFARTMGLTPKTPPELGQLVMMDIPASHYPPRSRRPILPSHRRDVYPPSSRTRYPMAARTPVLPSPKPRKADQDILFSNRGSKKTSPTNQSPNRVAPSGSRYRPVTPIESTPRRSATPKRPIRQPYSIDRLPAPRTEKRQPTIQVPTREQMDDAPIPAQILIQGDTAGRAPLWVNMSVHIPPEFRDGVSILWTDNNMPIGNNGFDLQTVLREPGEHAITSHILTADDRKITAHQTVSVIGPASQPAGS